MMSTVPERDSELLFGPFRLRPHRRHLERGRDVVKIGSRALDLLIALTERQGEVVGHQELLDRVWPDTAVEESGLRVQIAGLRRVLGDGRADARYVVTVPGRGYCFVASVQRRDEEDPGAAAPAATDPRGAHEPGEGNSVDVGSLVERVATHVAATSLTVGDAHAIEQLCRRLDTLASALRSAANQVATSR